MPLYSHSAYEVVDADAVGMGQRVLRESGWTHAWGIGRHILGSQIFDYWQDPWGDKHEHYCDGDLFTADAADGRAPGQPRGDVAVGAGRCRAASRGRSSRRRRCRRAVRNLRRSPDLTLERLLTLARSSADWPRHLEITHVRQRRPLPASRAHPMGRRARRPGSRRSRANSPRPASSFRGTHRPQLRRSKATRSTSRRRDALAGHAQPAVRLPGRELSPAHDRVGRGPGREDVQHDLHQGAELHRARRRRRDAAGRVRFLDYEIELGLVLERDIRGARRRHRRATCTSSSRAPSS